MTAAIVTMSIRRAVTSVHNACTRTAVIQSRKGRDSKDHQEQNCDNQNLLHGVVSYRFHTVIFPLPTSIIRSQDLPEVAAQATFCGTPPAQVQQFPHKNQNRRILRVSSPYSPRPVA